MRCYRVKQWKWRYSMMMVFVLMIVGCIWYREGAQVTKFWKMQRVGLLARQGPLMRKWFMMMKVVVMRTDRPIRLDQTSQVIEKKISPFSQTSACSKFDVCLPAFCAETSIAGQSRLAAPMPPARMSGFLPHICSHFYWHTHPHWVNKSLFKSPFA